MDVIYIDPPYNTGNKDDKDFRYNDAFVDKTDTYRHSKWLSFMQKRLEIAKNLLNKNGVIFISIDDNEQATLKLLCDEIFGIDNFVAEIVRNTNSSKNQSLFVSISHEYCVVYAKNITSLTEKHKENKWAVEKNNLKEYVKTVNTLRKKGLSDEEITEELKELTKYPRFIDFMNYWYFDERGLYRKGDLGGVKDGNNNPLFNPITKKFDPVPPGGYRYKTEKLEKLVEENRIHFHTDGSLPTIKRYLHENPKQRPKSIMSDDQRPDYALLKKMKIKFNNPKQMSFMTRILSIFDKNSVILDFFAGSGTTGHAVAQLNKEDGGSRRYILCTNNENEICEKVTYQRLKNIQDELPHKLKYLKTEFIEKFSEKGVSLTTQLSDYLQPLIELQWGVEIDDHHLILIQNENDLAEKLTEQTACNATIFISPYLFLSAAQNALVAEKGLKVVEIPAYYFKHELIAGGEL